MSNETKRNLAVCGGALAAEGLAYLLSRDGSLIGTNWFQHLVNEGSKYFAYATLLPSAYYGVRAGLEKLLKVS